MEILKKIQKFGGDQYIAGPRVSKVGGGTGPHGGCAYASGCCCLIHIRFVVDFSSCCRFFVDLLYNESRQWRSTIRYLAALGVRNLTAGFRQKQQGLGKREEENADSFCENTFSLLCLWRI